VMKPFVTTVHYILVLTIERYAQKESWHVGQVATTQRATYAVTQPCIQQPILERHAPSQPARQTNIVPTSLHAALMNGVWDLATIHLHRVVALGRCAASLSRVVKETVNNKAFVMMHKQLHAVMIHIKVYCTRASTRPSAAET